MFGKILPGLKIYSLGLFTLVLGGIGVPRWQILWLCAPALLRPYIYKRFQKINISILLFSSNLFIAFVYW